jgi:glutathione S-transferase
MTTLSKPRLVYFNSRGLAEPIRVILAEAGVDYDDVGFGPSEPGKQPEEFIMLKSEGKLMFDQVPLWEEPSGLALVQSNAIIRHLARTHGLYGKNEQEAAIADALYEYMIDTRNLGSQAARAQDPIKKEELKKAFLEVDLPKVFNRLENILKKVGTGFLVSSHITYADLLWWYYIENCCDQGFIDVSHHEHLSKFKALIEARPKIAAYRSDPKRHPLQYLFPRYVMITYEGNIAAQKSYIAAQYGGIKIEQPPFKWAVDNKTPEFFKKNPNGQVPTMDSPDGPIYESNAIAKYVARKGNDKGLYGANEYEASIIDQWIEWFRSRCEDELSSWVAPVFGWGKNDKEKIDAAKVHLAKMLGILNNHLEGKEWIVGKRVTLADIILFVGFQNGFQHVMEPEYLKPFHHVTAWVHRCLEQSQFKAVITKFEFCQKEKQAGELKEDDD